MLSLFLEHLPECLEGGVRLASAKIEVLVYADDIVLQNYCVQWGLEINLAKCKIVFFRRGSRFSHIKERVSTAKMALEIFWSGFVTHNIVALSHTIQLFNAVFRFIAC